MISILNTRNIYLYKLNINELKYIKCKLPISIEEINTQNTAKVLNFRNIVIKNSFNCMLNSGGIGVYGVLCNQAIAHAWCIVNKENKSKKIKPFYKSSSKIAYIHFCNVTERLRGNNIFPYLLYNLIKAVNQNYNIDTFYIDTSEDNIASQEGIKKLGFKFYNKYKFIFVLNHLINRRILK